MLDLRTAVTSSNPNRSSNLSTAPVSSQGESMMGCTFGIKPLQGFKIPTWMGLGWAWVRRTTDEAPSPLYLQGGDQPTDKVRQGGKKATGEYFRSLAAEGWEKKNPSSCSWIIDRSSQFFRFSPFSFRSLLQFSQAFLLLAWLCRSFRHCARLLQGIVSLPSFLRETVDSCFLFFLLSIHSVEPTEPQCLYSSCFGDATMYA